MKIMALPLPRAAHLVTTMRAAFWMFAGRGAGLLWTVFIIHQFGIGSYGTYAMAFALATIIAVPIDNYFFVGSVRSSDEDFRRDRATRLLVGSTIFVLGAFVYPVAFVAGFGIVLAGGEIAFNALQSTWMRAGRPDRLMINTTVRQTLCIATAVGVVVVGQDVTLEQACIGYLAPYLLSILYTLRLLRTDRPQWPRGRARMGLLVLDAVGIALYEQADVLLLGLLIGEATAGYYATAQVAATAASAVGVSYAQTFHEPLRAAKGHPSAGPPPRQTALIGLGIGLCITLTGGVLEVLGASDQLWGAFLIMSVFTALRFSKHALTVVLIVQHRDAVRVATTFGCIAIKGVLLLTLAVGLGWGSIGAATAAVLAEIVLVTAYAWLVQGSAARPADADADPVEVTS